LNHRLKESFNNPTGVSTFVPLFQGGRRAFCGRGSSLRPPLDLPLIRFARGRMDYFTNVRPCSRGDAFQRNVRVCPPIVLLILTLVSQLAPVHAIQRSKNEEAHLLRGLAHMDKDRHEDAIKEFNQAIVANPKEAELRYQLGLAQWKLGKSTEASASFVRALQLAPDHALARYYLGRTFLQAQNLPKGIESFEKVIQSGSGKPVMDEYFQLGKAYLTMKRTTDAIRILEAGVKVQPRDDRLYAQLGRAYLSLGRKPEAETALAKSNELRDYQREATSRLLQGSEFLKGGDVEKALPIYQWFLNSDDIDDLVSLGIQFGQHGLHEQATQLLTKALGLSPDLFEAHFNLGLSFLRTGKEDQAETHLTSAAVLRPYSFEASSVLGVVLSQRGKTEEAIKALQRAEILKPEDLKVATLLALQLTEGRYYTEAVRLLDRSVKRWPESLDLRLLLIQNYHRDQKYEKAVQAAEQTLVQFPNAARANFEMGYQLLAFGRMQQAKPYLAKAIQLDPEPPDGYVSLGEVLAKEDNHAEAIRYFRLALDRDSSHVEAALGLAKSLLTLKRYAEVVPEMQRVIQQDPANPQPHFHLSQAFVGLGDKEKAQQETETFRQLNQKRMLRRDHEGGRELPAR